MQKDRAKLQALGMFYEMTTEIPHSVSIAIPKESNSPKIDYPPISQHRFSKEA